MVACLHQNSINQAESALEALCGCCCHPIGVNLAGRVRHADKDAYVRISEAAEMAVQVLARNSGLL